MRLKNALYHTLVTSLNDVCNTLKDISIGSAIRCMKVVRCTQVVCVLEGPLGFNVHTTATCDLAITYVLTCGYVLHLDTRTVSKVHA